MFSFDIEVGAIYKGSPEFTISDTNNFISDLDLNLEEDLLEDYEDYTWYPVVMLGFTIRF